MTSCGLQKNAEAYRVRIVEKYSQIKAHIEEDQKLMLAILETEEIYTNKWLRWRSESLKCHVKEINAVLKSSQTLLEAENDVRFLQVHIISLFFSAHFPFVFFICIFSLKENKIDFTAFQKTWTRVSSFCIFLKLHFMKN